jgi:hypothetical protein
MSIRNTIIFLVIFVGLAWYVMSTGSKPAEETTAVEGESEPIALFEVDAGDVQALAVEDTMGETVRVERDGDAWRLTEPMKADADEIQVTQTITDLTELSATRAITPPDDLAPFGLETPAHTIRLFGEEDEELALLHVGARNPRGTSVYIQRDDDPTIYLVNGFAIGSITAWIASPPKEPTPLPTQPPTEEPTEAPTEAPTAEPTEEPTASPEATETTKPLTETLTFPWRSSSEAGE